MAIKSYNPVTPGQRGKKTIQYKDVLTKNAVVPASLIGTKKKTGGRNAQGKARRLSQGRRDLRRMPRDTAHHPPLPPPPKPRRGSAVG